LKGDNTNMGSQIQDEEYDSEGVEGYYSEDDGGFFGGDDNDSVPADDHPSRAPGRSYSEEDDDTEESMEEEDHNNDKGEVQDLDSHDQDTNAPVNIRDRFRQFCDPDRFVAPLPPVYHTGIKLMDILRRKKAPMNAYKDLFEWNLREKGVIMDHQDGKDAPVGDNISRDVLMKKLTSRYGLTHMMPYERTVRLPSSKEVVKIPCHDARDCIEQLLTDPRIKDDDYCFFDDDPLAAPQDLDYVEDMITGKAFSDTYDALIDGDDPKEGGGGGNKQLLGVIFYIDGAVTGQFANLPVTILKLSLTIFNREARMKDYCWANLGYVPYVKISEGRGKKIFKESLHMEAQAIEIMEGEGGNVEGDDQSTDSAEEDGIVVKAQDFHTMLSIILESYVKLQETGFIWDLVYKGKLYEGIQFTLFCPIVRTDADEADVLAGKYKSRTKNVKHICRTCHCPTKDADKYTISYPYKTQKDIQKLVSSRKFDQLAKISQHYLKNAWYKVRFNQGNDRGIHGACPSEMLHAMLLGIFKYTRDIFFNFVGESAEVAQDINGLAKAYGKIFSHQSDRSFGSTNFSKGIKEGKLMAKDYRGVLLNMAAVLQSTKGRELLHTKRRFKQDESKDDWILLVEMLLEWEAYLNEPKMFKKDVKRLKEKHKYIMYLMKKVAKRTKGMGLKIMKYHAILHMVDDIQLYGVPLEFDTAANESHHKPSKQAAKLTQRNESTFNIQVAKRLFEFLILDLAMEEVYHGRFRGHYYKDADLVGEEVAKMDVSYQKGDQESSKSHSSSSSSSSSSSPQPQARDINIYTGGTRIVVHEDKDNPGENAFFLLSRSKKKDETGMSTDLLDFLKVLQDKIIDHIPQSSLQIYTEHVRGDTIWHGHPNFRGQGPWNDWAIVDWGVGYGKLPCHISCFVEVEDLPEGHDAIEYGGIRVKDGVYAVVESSTYENDKDEGWSELFEPIKKEIEELSGDGKEVVGRRFYLADVEAFDGPCCVVPDIGGPPNRYFFVHPRTEWSKFFLRFVQEPHTMYPISDVESGDDDPKQQEKRPAGRKKSRKK